MRCVFYIHIVYLFFTTLNKNVFKKMFSKMFLTFSILDFSSDWSHFQLINYMDGEKGVLVAYA